MKTQIFYDDVFLFINYFYHPADHLFGRTFFMFLSSPCLLSPNQELSNKKEMFMNNNQIILSLPRKLFALLLLHHRLAPKRGTKTNCFNEKKIQKKLWIFLFSVDDPRERWWFYKNTHFIARTNENNNINIFIYQSRAVESINIKPKFLM